MHQTSNEWMGELGEPTASLLITADDLVEFEEIISNRWAVFKISGKRSRPHRL